MATRDDQMTRTELLAELERLRRELTQAEDLYRIQFEANPEGVLILALDGTILARNPAMERITGRANSEVVGRWAALSRSLAGENEGRLRKIFARLAAGETTAEPFQLEIVTSDGEKRQLDVHAAMIKRDNRNHAIQFICRDVTHQRRMEQELRRADRLEAVGHLAGGIAHDFNNLLAGILGNLSLARFDMVRGEELRQVIIEAEAAALRAQELTRQLLTFSRGGAPVKGPASISEILTNSANFILRGSNVRSECRFDPQLGLIPADAGQVSQVINNLLINAKQAMPGGGSVSLTAERVPLAEDNPLGLPGGPYAKVSVSDQGVGIEPHILPRIFDLYFTTKTKGNGLGLAIAYSIVKQHGGTIVAESEPGRGSVFRVFLPAPLLPSPPPSCNPESLAPGEGRVLFIDDEEAVRKVTAMILTKLGYSVVLAAEGREGLERYVQARREGKPFNLVITDLTIPGGMGGVETATELLRLDPAARIIVASGYSNEDVMAHPAKYGFQAAIPKPFLLTELGSILRNVLDRAPRPEGNDQPEGPGAG
jgi:two-component system, cell cycle sensor histidine kinase and response regulator CckA